MDTGWKTYVNLSVIYLTVVHNFFVMWDLTKFE